MELVVEISFNSICKIYFIQSRNEGVAKEKAYKKFKETINCCLLDTLKEAMKDNNFSIKVVGDVIM